MADIKYTAERSSVNSLLDGFVLERKGVVRPLEAIKL